MRGTKLGSVLGLGMLLLASVAVIPAIAASSGSARMTAQVSIGPGRFEVPLFDVGLAVMASVMQEEMPELPEQAVRPVHEKTMEAGEFVHIEHMIDSRAVTLTIVIDVDVQEGTATHSIDKDIHPPTPDIGVPPVSPPDDVPRP